MANYIDLIIIRLKPKLFKLRDNKYLKLFKYLERLILKILELLNNYCTLMVDDIDTIHPTITFKEELKQTKDLIGHWFNWDKPKKNVKIEPIKRKVEKAKEEKPKENKYPWDIAQEIITEQNRASLAVKWSAIPLEALFDEQFLTILHAVEELTDVSPLQNAVTQLPKSIYEIVEQYEHMPVVSAKSTDDLIYNISKTYFYSVIESLCRLIKSIQQGQGTSLVSMARVINEQKEVIEKYQELIKLPNQIKEMQDQLQEQIEQIKGRTSKHLDRIDRRAITTCTTISEIRSQIHKIENTLESNNITMEQPERPGWTFPEDMVELHAPNDDDLFHTDEDTSSLNSEVMDTQAS